MKSNYKTINQSIKNLAKAVPVLLTFLFFLSVLALLFPGRTFAQSLSLSISPPLLEIIMKPGKSLTQAYKIANSGDPLILTPRLTRFDENGINIDNEFKKDDWINFINLDASFDQPFILATGQEKQFILKISPPKDLPQKDYYRALVFATSPNPPANLSQSAQSLNIGSILLINITAEGIISKSAQITDFQLPKLIDSFDPLETVVKVKNTGSSFFRPLGQINLSGSIAKASFEIAPNIFLAGQTRTLTLSKQNLFYSDNKTLSLPGFYLGKYLLEVRFTLDEGNIIVSQSKTFYAIPWKAILMVFTSILILVIILKLRKRKRK